MENESNNRVISLDFLRGAIMVLLVLETTGWYNRVFEIGSNSFLRPFFIQYLHHPWNGLHLGDLIQPCFMFIAGTALAFSLQQIETGMAWKDQLFKISKRCAWLFFWGVLYYALQPQGLVFELWDVLTQLAFTTLIAFLYFQMVNHTPNFGKCWPVGID